MSMAILLDNTNVPIALNDDEPESESEEDEGDVEAGPPLLVSTLHCPT